MKKILIIGAMIVGSGIFAGCGGSGVNETGATESSVESSAEVSKQGYHVEIMKQDSFELVQQWNIIF